MYNGWCHLSSDICNILLRWKRPVITKTRYYEDGPHLQACVLSVTLCIYLLALLYPIQLLFFYFVFSFCNFVLQIFKPEPLNHFSWAQDAGVWGEVHWTRLWDLRALQTYSYTRYVASMCVKCLMEIFFIVVCVLFQQLMDVCLKLHCIWCSQIIQAVQTCCEETRRRPGKNWTRGMRIADQIETWILLS